MLFGEPSLFIVRTIRNTQIHCVGRTQSFGVLKQMAHILTNRLQRVNRYIRSTEEEIMLNTSERNVLKLYGLVTEQGVWRIRTNKEQNYTKLQIW
jgi:hypothetical protein